MDFPLRETFIIQPIIEQMQSRELPGDRISEIGYTIFKLQVKNSHTTNSCCKAQF
ncbi:hypothetical protein [Nostoc sp.]|uniref:hypothetical protein n=1 Tax=Nostoc sp. TaxID=1180 RepID=UPI0035937977